MWVESAVDTRRPGDIQIPQPMETPEDQDRNKCGERVPRHASRQCAADEDWRRLRSFQLRPPRRATHRARVRWATRRLSPLARRERSLTRGTRPQTGAKFRRSRRLRAASTLTVRRHGGSRHKRNSVAYEEAAPGSAAGLLGKTHARMLRLDGWFDSLVTLYLDREQTPSPTRPRATSRDKLEKPRETYAPPMTLLRQVRRRVS